MANQSLSTQIYTSRNEIKNQIIEYMQSYLELENIDLVQSSFLSFLIEVISTLTSNIMFYQISTYREFFMTTAQLPESILNLSAFLGYSGANATPATVDVLVTIPYGFTQATDQFSLPEGFTFYADDVEFKTYYTTTVTITNNESATVQIQVGNTTYYQTVLVDDDGFNFTLPLRQFSIDQQEFKIDEDLEPFQFFSVDVTLDGQVSTATVEVQDPGDTSWTTWAEYQSLYLMDNNDTGYILRRTDTGIEVSFGNGLIGVQPPPGGLVRVTTNLTEGAEGNVIAGSITSGDRVYNNVTSGSPPTTKATIVNYTVVNNSSASGGSDQESVEAIRSNSIASLVALNRAVSEDDYKNIDVIISGAPVNPNSLPILKRSDLRINEISLFTTFNFSGSIVPTRNASQEYSSMFIQRNSLITINGVDYYTLFDMTIDPLNLIANYQYVVYELDSTPALTTTYDSDYDLQLTTVTASRVGNSAVYEVAYQSTESDADSTKCRMEIVENGAVYEMTNDSSASFILTFPDYNVIPDGELTYRFVVRDASDALKSAYTTQFTFVKDLSDQQLSNVTTDGTTYTVYDIPVVKKSYYDSINQKDFELQIMQEIVNTMSFEDYRMTTDFVNLKFGNTTGALTNMQLNTSTATIVDILCDPPSSGSSGSKYIVGKGTGAWEGYDDYIATLTDATAMTWVFTQPNPDQIVTNQSDGYKYIYSEDGWVIPIYEIPLKISVDVFKSSSYSGSSTDLVQAVRTAIYNNFSANFGINFSIYRSEIYDVVQGVEGVKNCKVVEPESNIFFNYDIDEFTQQQLLEFGPDYIYFTESDITVRIF